MKFTGKAGSLQYLKSLGLEVPDFLIITHEEFSSWGDQTLLQKLYQALHEKNRDLITTTAKSFLASVAIPESTLLWRKDANYYAVRSSANLEDSPDHSFAGIFESILFVSQNINEAIKDVWGSLFQAKALDYCEERDLSWQELTMNIIVQEMIDGEKSGVLFQADPTGFIHHQVIVAGPGLGQGIVDDITDTDRYIIESYKLLEQTIRHKSKAMFFDFNQQQLITKEMSLDTSTLNEKEIAQLLAVSAKLDKANEYFLDIEFTFKDGNLYLLQARPITTIPAKKEIIVFDNSNIAENYPGQSTPLTYSGLARGYTKNFENLIRSLGYKEHEWTQITNDLEQLVGYWGGQIYYNLNHWYQVYALLPIGGQKAAASFNEMVGITTNAQLAAPHSSILKRLSLTFRVLPRVLYAFIRARHFHHGYKNRFKEIYQSSMTQFDDTKDLFTCIRLLKAIDDQYLALIKTPLINDFFSSVLNSLCRKLAKYLHPDGERLYNDLLSNKENLESSKAIYSLIALAETVSNNSSLKTFLEDNYQSKSILNDLTESFPGFSKDLKLHFDLYGDRAQWEMKIESPAAREIPQTTLKLILEYANSGLSREEQREREKSKFTEAQIQFAKCFWRKPLSYLTFKVLVRKCTEALCFREDSRFDRVRMKGLNRRIIMKLSSMLVERKWLSQIEDIYYLTYEEIISLTHDSYGGDYWKELAALRKKHLEQFKDTKLPDRIITNDLMNVNKFALNKAINSKSSLTGIPCSGGIVEAPCEVVTDLNQVQSLAGKILVAERTDPSWGYFFVGVKGIIIEKGSMLSHAAIISRELGIPCIINAQNATQHFKSGMSLKMNGDTGEIEVIST